MAPDRFDQTPGVEEAPAEARKMKPAPTHRGGLVYLIGFVLVIGAIIGWFLLHTGRSAALEEAREFRAHQIARGPLVQTARVASGSELREVTLLGDAQPFQSATLYAKVSGYLERIEVDKGDRVKEGAVIAEISSPELDHQYAGALADLENKRRVLRRAQLLARHRDVPQQTVDNAQRDVTVAEATARELASLKGYQVVRAPFSGIITARFADPGALVQSAETNQQNALALVNIADDSRLRVYIHVPQTEAPFVRAGQKAVVADATNPGRVVEAEVARTSGALDPETRTLLTEIDIKRPDPGAGGYFPLAGSFVYVTLHVPVEALPEIPATALILREGKQQVAVIRPDNHVHLLPVRVVQTDGRTMRINGDLKPGQRIAENLPVSVGEGDLIRPVRPEGAGTK